MYRVCSHSHDLILEHFHHPQKIPSAHLQSFPIPILQVWVCPYVATNFADMVKDLKMRRLFWIIKVGPM